MLFQQNGQMEREEMKLLSLLLAPVSRIHSYLSHIQVSQRPPVELQVHQCDTAGQPQVHSILKTLRAEDTTRENWR